MIITHLIAGTVSQECLQVGRRTILRRGPGQKPSDGHYFIVVASGDSILSSLDAGELMFFTGQPWSGLNALTVPGLADHFFSIVKFGSCLNKQDFHAYSVDGRVIRPVRFLMKEGNRVNNDDETKEPDGCHFRATVCFYKVA